MTAGLKVELGQTSLTFVRFVSVWNMLQGRATPPLHAHMATWLEERWLAGDRRLLLLVFRDAGKSTIVGLFCAWLLVHDPNLRILVLSAEESLATKLTRNVRRVLVRHPAAGHLLPDSREEWAASQLTVQRDIDHRDPSLLARGIGANVTGSRADIVICDDVEVPNTSDTDEKRGKLRERLREVGFVLVPGGLQLFIGTPHSYHSIYAEEPRPELGETEAFLHDFTRKVLPLVSRRVCAWPDRFAPKVVSRIRRDSGPLRFRSQMMLRPSHTREMRLDPRRLVRYSDPLELREGNGERVVSIAGRRMRSSVCWWDPAVGRAERGDSSVVALVLVDGEGHYHVHGVSYLRVEAPEACGEDEAAQLCRQVTDFLQATAQAAIVVETNGLGRFLPALLRRTLRNRGLPVAVREHVSTTGKDQRILDAFDPLLAAGALHAHAGLWNTPFIREMQEWLPGGRGRDDGLDAVSGCILSLPVRLHAQTADGTSRTPIWRPLATGFRAGTDFKV